MALSGVLDQINFNLEMVPKEKLRNQSSHSSCCEILTIIVQGTTNTKFLWHHIQRRYFTQNQSGGLAK